MRRFIAAVTDTITTRSGMNADGNIVTGLATLALRASSLARRVLLRLTGLSPGAMHAACVCHVRPVEPGSGAKPRDSRA